MMKRCHVYDVGASMDAAQCAAVRCRGRQGEVVAQQELPSRNKSEKYDWKTVLFLCIYTKVMHPRACPGMNE
jgi:hypothetical protein